ncbi:hypothetical protein ACIBTV_18080 [Micromonospora sp. NPDC049366]|uniref:hypothetical protein n=1 Tax=Micromonospora sp. NPDC049366 TaxID=3364271 RepID=UPI003794B1D5
MPADTGLPNHGRTVRQPPHVYAYDLVDGRNEPTEDPAEELIVDKPFDIRPRVRDAAP